jgi:hypothetical protein
MLTARDCCLIIDNILKKITASQKPLQDLVVIIDNSQLSGHLLLSEGSEQFKEHCAIYGTGLSLNTTQPYAHTVASFSSISG